MEPMRQTVSVAVALFAYGGNGGTSSLIPELAVWFAKAYHRFKVDPRVHQVGVEIYSDTPIYMTRNRAVRDAINGGFDFLLMLDSDNEPDAYFGHDKDAKLFLDEPFNFAYDRLKQGIPTVIAAPYCGPPPNPVNRAGVTENGEVPYLFQWSNNESDSLDSKIKSEMLTRLDASRLRGIHPMSALPTGVSLFTLNAFNGVPKPYFDYEHDPDKTEKMGTEDCFATRNISLYWKMTKGWDVCFAACDSWALHHKPKKVGKPRIVTLENVADEMREAILTNRSGLIEDRIIDYTANMPDVSRLPRRGEVLSHDQNEIYLTEEDLEHARILSEREASTGSEIADIRSAVEAAEVSGQLWIDEQTPDPDYSTVTTANDEEHSNGQALRHKMVEGRKVAIIDKEVEDSTLDGVQALTSWLVKRNDTSPVEVAVIHPGTGQSAAAILSQMPEGSHLYALDTTLTYQFSSKHSIEFSKSFQNELESGRVMADISGRKFPWPESQQHLDMVFVERCLTAEKLTTAWTHVTQGGILAGLGYTDSKTQKVVDAFGDGKLKTSGDVWAIVK